MRTLGPEPLICVCQAENETEGEKKRFGDGSVAVNPEHQGLQKQKEAGEP